MNSFNKMDAICKLAAIGREYTVVAHDIEKVILALVNTLSYPQKYIDSYCNEGKIKAIKLYKEHTHCGLLDAKNHIEKMAAELKLKAKEWKPEYPEYQSI